MMPLGIWSEKRTGGRILWMVFLILAVAWGLVFLSHPVLAEESADDFEDFSVEEAEPEKLKSEFSPSNKQEGSDALKKTSPEKGFWANWIAPAKSTLRYEWGQGLAGEKQPLVNRAGYRLEWEKLLTKGVFMRVDGKGETLAGNDHQTRAFPDNNQLNRGELREAYLQVNMGNISVKAGRQVVVWGEAEGAVVADVISPRDLSEFLFIPLADSRLGQDMLTVEVYSSAGQWSLVLNPSPRPNRLPEPGSEYHTWTDPASLPGVVLDVPQGETMAERGEAGLRWKNSFEGGDVSLMTAHLKGNNPAYRSEGVGTDGFFHITKFQAPYNMVALGGNISKGNFLWKAEGAYKHGRTFQTNDPTVTSGIVMKNTSELVAGLEYSAAGAYTLTFWLSTTHINDWNDSLTGTRKDARSLVASWNKSFLHETLSAYYSLMYFPQEKGTVHLTTISYSATDRLKITGTLGQIESSDPFGTFAPYKDKDRFTLSTEYTF